MRATERWPRLTETLPREVTWGRCQKCGKMGGKPGEHTSFCVIWREHDNQDRPEPRAVVLCGSCSSIIEPHPRLYARQQRDVPLPGVMELCRDCTHRRGYLCEHPDLTVNGGPGLKIAFPRPAMALVDGIRGGRRTGWRETIWSGPPTDCAGREVSALCPEHDIPCQWGCEVECYLADCTEEEVQAAIDSKTRPEEPGTPQHDGTSTQPSAPAEGASGGHGGSET